MRKLAIIFFICFCFFTYSYAQVPGNIEYNNYRSSSKDFGFKGGINFSNIYGSDVGDTKSKTGFIAGFFYEIYRTKQFSIQPELLFSMKGWKFENSLDSVGSYTYWAKLNYIEIPILGKFNINTTSNIKPIIYFGPCLGFNVSSTYRVEVDEYGDNSTDTGSMENMSVFEFSLTPGVMLELNNQFIFDFRYSIGLIDIYEVDESFDPVKNSVISFMLGMKL